MKVFKFIFWTLWRLWFYVLVVFLILLLLPLLLVSILKESNYPFFFKIARIWSKSILIGMGFYYKLESKELLKKNQSYVFVANHTSMIDIMLMIAIVKKPFVFVGKKELSKIPLFGFFYKRTCILVDRKSSKSRYSVFLQAQKKINQGLSICIFPEGGVPNDESILLDSFKEGAFRLAINHQLAIVPITFADNKKRFSFTFFSGSPGLMRVKIHSIIETKGKILVDKNSLKEQVWNTIYEQLKEFQIKVN